MSDPLSPAPVHADTVYAQSVAGGPPPPAGTPTGAGDRATRKITRRQSRFVDAYLATWSQVEAARLAGYSFPENQAWRIIRNPAVVEEIKTRMSAMAMQGDEVLLRLRQMGSVKPADFFIFEMVQDKDTNGNPIYDQQGEPIKRSVMSGIDWEFLQKHSHLVKKISYSRKDIPIIEFHDPQKALELIGKHLKLFTDQVDVTSKGESIKPNDDGRDRTISTLADALREIVSKPVAKQTGAVDAAEQTPVAGTSESSG